jgi:hypothetical protein
LSGTIINEQPGGLVSADGSLWAVTEQGTVTQVDLARGRVVGSTPLALPTGPGGMAVGLGFGDNTTASVITRKYERRAAVYSTVIELLRDPATRDYPLYGAGPIPKAKGRFLWNPSGEGHIFVSNLPRPPQGKMYAVWTIAHGASPRHVGKINTDAAGQGSLHIKSTANGKSVETFAVSVEPVGAVDAPTGPIVLASKPS